ncbi:hypothetical protein R1flu_015973 [Riccia fluitans]|uniref:Uncharacterized protein n=1 Tax=Riccia fluitans TaxID=41844 RepID=A0ABD1YNK7_9MARC
MPSVLTRLVADLTIFHQGSNLNLGGEPIWGPGELSSTRRWDSASKRANSVSILLELYLQARFGRDASEVRIHKGSPTEWSIDGLCRNCCWLGQTDPREASITDLQHLTNREGLMLGARPPALYLLAA